MREPKNNVAETLGRFATQAVLVCFLALITLLALVAAVSTATMDVLPAEHTYHLPDNPLVNVVFVVALVVAVRATVLSPRFAHARTWLVSDRGFFLMRAVLLALVFVAACAWVLLLRPVPCADQEDVLRIAGETLAGDWHELDKGGYLSAYPFQLGIVLVLRCFVAVFGTHAATVFELSNAVALVLFYYTLGKVLERLGAGRLQQLAVVVVGLAFFPLIQYATFVYGTLWGLALATLAMRFELDFFSTRQIRCAVCSAVAMAMALMCKENYRIFLIAMVLVAVLELMTKRERVLLVMPAVLLVALLVQSAVPRAYVERASGKQVAGGCSPWSYLAMGMQESYADCGWFSAYNIRTYRVAGDNTAVQAEEAKRELFRACEDFAQHPRGALRFYTRKIASQWNNPTFQGAWVAQACVAQRPLEGFRAKLVGRTITDASYAWLNLVQFAILVGAGAWAALADWGGGRTRWAAVLLLTVLGGFVCHVFWEAKSQYALPYFALLLPLAVMGYARLVRQVRMRRAAMVAMAAVCALFAVCCLFGALDYLTFDVSAYHWYVTSNPIPRILRGF